MKRVCIFILGGLLYSESLLYASDAVPSISFQDLKALYPKDKVSFDLAWPTTALSVTDKGRLIEECQRDFSVYFQQILSKRIPSNVRDKLVLLRITKNPQSSTIYMIFEIDPEIASDLMIVYFVNAKDKHLMLKMML